MRGKINANLHGEQRQTALRKKGSSLCRLLYWDLAETLTHLDMKEVSLGWLHKLWCAPAAASSPGAQNRSRLTQAGLREAREMLGLCTQELRPWGLKHQATDNDVLYQSLFSKPIRALGASEKVTISSLSVWRQLFLSQTSRHKLAELWGMQLKSHRGERRWGNFASLWSG